MTLCGRVTYVGDRWTQTGDVKVSELIGLEGRNKKEDGLHQARRKAISTCMRRRLSPHEKSRARVAINVRVALDEPRARVQAVGGGALGPRSEVDMGAG